MFSLHCEHTRAPLLSPIYDKMENALCAYRFEISTLRFINKFEPFYRFARYPKSIIGNPWRINSIHKATLGRRTI